ncbi:MAG: glycosyltransferase family 4 protein [bacterium]
MSVPRLLRVGLDGRPLQPGFAGDGARGVGVYARELLAALAARHDLVLTVWFDRARPVPDGVVPPGVRIRRYASPLPLGERLAAQFTVPLAAGERSHDVFHWLSHRYAPALPPRGAVITVHDLLLERHPEWSPDAGSAGYRAARAIEASALRRATVLVADTEDVRETLVADHGVERARVSVAPLGVHPRFAPVSAAEVAGLRKHLALDAPFVLHVGGLGPRKGVPLLFEAFARARKRRRKHRLLLVLAGSAPDDPALAAVHEGAAELGIADDLRVLPPLPLEHLARLLTAARVFAVSSRAEGYGLPALEAMACGTPVVSTTGGALGEVMGDAALLVAPGDLKGFATALERAAHDESVRARLIAAGRTRAAAHTWERTAEATVAAYRAAVALVRGA